MDQELLAQARAGDRAAFGMLYERHEAVVWRFTVHRVHLLALAEDIVQDTFLEVLKHGERFDPERGVSFETYLCSIADKLIRKHRRKQARTIAVLDWLMPQTGKRNLRAAENQINDLLDVDRALEHLPERQREAFRLSETEDFSVQQVSAELNLSLPATKSLLFRARAGVRKFLGLGGEPRA